MKIYASKKRAVKFHAIFQLALAFLLFSETSCGSTKYGNLCRVQRVKKDNARNKELFFDLARILTCQIFSFFMLSRLACVTEVYEGPDGCNSNDCSCETEKKVEQVNDELVTTSTTTCYNISSYSGPGEFFVRKIPQPVVNGMRKVRGFMVNKVNQARSYCQNVCMHFLLSHSKIMIFNGWVGSNYNLWDILGSCE